MLPWFKMVNLSQGFFHLIIFEASSLHSLSVERQHTGSRMIDLDNGYWPACGVTDDCFGNTCQWGRQCKIWRNQSEARWLGASMTWASLASLPPVIVKFSSTWIQVGVFILQGRGVYFASSSPVMQCFNLGQKMHIHIDNDYTLTILSWQTRIVSFSNWVTDTMFISSWRGTTVCVPSASSNSSLMDLRLE